MLRRDVLKLLTSSAVLSAIPLEAMVALRQARAQVELSNGLRTLNPHQDATLTTMCELIIPETDTPGAKGAKVNEFVDLMLTDWFEKTDTERFLQGLGTVDARSRKLFGKDFVRCTPAQQVQLMKQMDAEAMEFAHSQKKVVKTTTAPLTSAVPLTPASPFTTTNFFYALKKLTLLGYYTSEIGFEKELGKSVIPPRHQGCAPLAEARQ